MLLYQKINVQSIIINTYSLKK